MGAVSLAVAFAGGYVALLALRVTLAWPRLRGRDAPPRSRDAMADVAVLQPILSGDPRLPEVLAHNLRTLPAAHFHWLVDADDERAQDIAARLRERHQDATIDVQVHPAPPDGVNPKTFKLARGLDAVRRPVCLVLDDDARLPATALATLLAALDDADLATALPGHAEADTLPGRLLAQFVNDNAALTYLAPLAFAPPLSINGMCYALRSERLRAWGGFAPLRHALADDLALAALVRRHGGRIAQTAAPVAVQTSLTDGRHYLRQMHRWMLFATLLLRQQPWRARIGIFLLQGLPPLLLWATLLTLALRPGPATLAVAMPALAARAALLAAVQRRAGIRARPRPLLSLLSELLQPLHLLHAVGWRRIHWRSRRYRVRADGGFDAI